MQHGRVAGKMQKRAALPDKTLSFRQHEKKVADARYPAWCPSNVPKRKRACQTWQCAFGDFRCGRWWNVGSAFPCHVHLRSRRRHRSNVSRICNAGQRALHAAFAEAACFSDILVGTTLEVLYWWSLGVFLYVGQTPFFQPVGSCGGVGTGRLFDGSSLEIHHGVRDQKLYTLYKADERRESHKGVDMWMWGEDFLGLIEICGGQKSNIEKHKKTVKEAQAALERSVQKTIQAVILAPHFEGEASINAQEVHILWAGGQKLAWRTRASPLHFEGLTDRTS